MKIPSLEFRPFMEGNPASFPMCRGGVSRNFVPRLLALGAAAEDYGRTVFPYSLRQANLPPLNTLQGIISEKLFSRFILKKFMFSPLDSFMKMLIIKEKGVLHVNNSM